MCVLGFIQTTSRSTEKIVRSIFIGLVCSGCSATASYQPNQTEQLALPKDIELRFNQLSAKDYRSPINGKQRPGENLEALIIESINGAEYEILLAVQSMEQNTRRRPAAPSTTKTAATRCSSGFKQ